jgi:PhzF family phenazine biosynthesis protein
MKLEVTFVSAFTDVAFRGNPAAVIVTQDWLSNELMQKIATENNLSETAFSVKQEQGCYKIRWFSPITEIDFCGHATLATAFVLFNQDERLQKLTFFADAVGKLTVTSLDNNFIQMSFPSRKPSMVEQIPSDLIDGLSIRPQEVYRNQQAYFAVYQNEEDVLAVTQEKERLISLAPYDVVVTAESAEYDFISRYFWPANGGDEDPVTGSIHAGLAPLWAEKLGKTELVAFQASQRGGYLVCRVDADRVLVSGQAVQYLEGSIEL